MPRGTVPVKARCPGYALVGPRSYDGAADLRITMRRARVRARALVDGAELAGARVLFAKDDETPIELDCIDPDQSYAVTVALEDEAYRIVGATARWPGGSRSWNNPYVTVALPHDAWAESSQVQLDVMLVATKAELLVDIREEASGFPVHDATFAVSIGDAVTTFDGRARRSESRRPIRARRRGPGLRGARLRCLVSKTITQGGRAVRGRHSVKTN